MNLIKTWVAGRERICRYTNVIIDEHEFIKNHRAIIRKISGKNELWADNKIKMYNLLVNDLVNCSDVVEIYESLDKFVDVSGVQGAVNYSQFRIPEINGIETERDAAGNIVRLNWMNYWEPSVYSDGDVVYLDFANQFLGGGYTESGFVQEEQMVAMCPMLYAILAFHEKDPITTRHVLGDNHLGNPNAASPVLLTGLTFTRKMSEHLMYNVYKTPVKDGINYVRVNPPPVSILALAAPKYPRDGAGKGIKYSLFILKDLFNNAYIGMNMIKNKFPRATIVSGRWGAGAFNHNACMTILIQCIAAAFAGIDKIVFTGLTNDENNFVKTIRPYITNTIGPMVRDSISVDAILYIILETYAETLRPYGGSPPTATRG